MEAGAGSTDIGVRGTGGDARSWPGDHVERCCCSLDGRREEAGIQALGTAAAAPTRQPEVMVVGEALGHEVLADWGRGAEGIGLLPSMAGGAGIEKWLA